jgi:hypothetical protein
MSPSRPTGLGAHGDALGARRHQVREDLRLALGVDLGELQRHPVLGALRGEREHAALDRGHAWALPHSSPKSSVKRTRSPTVNGLVERMPAPLPPSSSVVVAHSSRGEPLASRRTHEAGTWTPRRMKRRRWERCTAWPLCSHTSARLPGATSSTRVEKKHSPFSSQ